MLAGREVEDVAKEEFIGAILERGKARVAPRHLPDDTGVVHCLEREGFVAGVAFVCVGGGRRAVAGSGSAARSEVRLDAVEIENLEVGILALAFFIVDVGDVDLFELDAVALVQDSALARALPMNMQKPEKSLLYSPVAWSLRPMEMRTSV